MSKSELKNHRLSTKVSESDYQLAKNIARNYGLKSVYHLLQTLLECFLRHVDSVRDSRYDRGVGVEIDEMFDEMMGYEETPRGRNGRRV